MGIDIGKLTATWAEENSLAVHYFAQLDSTNNWAKQNLQTPDKITLVVTSHQTSGRGRAERTWQDNQAGSNLTASWLISPEKTPSPLTAPRMGLAVYRSLSAAFPNLDLNLKAPNDIYLGVGKLAGLLLENIQQGSKQTLIIGLGLNVGMAPSLSVATACLAQSTQVDVANWSAFLFNFTSEIKQLMKLIASPQNNELSESEQDELLQFLNQHPSLIDKYTSVSPRGDLSTRTRTVNWSEL